MTPDDIKARITARRVEAVERRAIAEAAGGVTWDDVENDAGAVLIHIAANDPATVIRDQDRIIAACDRDAELLDRTEEWHTEPEPNRSLGAVALLMNGMAETVFTNLAARYADTDGGAA